MKKLLAIGASSLLVASSLSACDHSDEEEFIAIGIYEDDLKNIVMSELYRQSLQRGGTPARLKPVDIEPGASTTEVQKTSMQLLQEGHIDLFVGCTGTILQNNSPSEAVEFSEEYVENDEDYTELEWLDETYIAMVGTLSRGVDATNPAVFEVCEQQEDEPLLQNMVPLYRNTLLDRDQRVLLNDITGGITLDELESLIELSEQDGDIKQVVTDFMDAR